MNWDYIINIYDQKLYWGNPEWRLIPHSGIVEVSDPKTCAYCGLSFEFRNQLFRHLGYMNLDIRCPTYIEYSPFNKLRKRRRRKRRYFRPISCSTMSNNRSIIPIINKGGISKHRPRNSNIQDLCDKMKKTNPFFGVKDLIDMFKLNANINKA